MLSEGGKTNTFTNITGRGKKLKYIYFLHCFLLTIKQVSWFWCNRTNHLLTSSLLPQHLFILFSPPQMPGKFPVPWEMAYLVTPAKRRLLSSSPKEPRKSQSNSSYKKLTALIICFQYQSLKPPPDSSTGDSRLEKSIL